nr:uncharacterized protein LOC113741087 [Coffea arabica]
MELGGWDIILGVDWMTHFSPITFNFYQLRISLHHEEDEIQLHGRAEDCDLDLIRRKDLRRFIKYKKQMCMAMSSAQNKGREADPIPSEVAELLQHYEDVFQTPSDLPPSRNVDHEIPLKLGTQPFKLKPYRYPIAIRRKLRSKLLRCCRKDRFSIPNVDELLDELTGAVLKTKLDLTTGYHHIRVKPQDTFKTAFQTHCGHFEFLVMPFGLTNAPVTFQSLMNQIFQPYLRKFVLVFFYDILVYSPIVEAHVHHLRIVFDILRRYYRRFIKHYGLVCKPLTELLRKDSFKWNMQAQNSFDQLKKLICSAPVLQLPDFKKSFVVETDASRGGIGAVLMHPIAFLSKTLSAKNLGLSVYEKELLALKLNTAFQHKWMTKLLGLDYVIQYKKELQKSYEDDTHYQDIIAKLVLDPNSHNDYTLVDGILKYQGRIYVGEAGNIREQVIRALHASAIGGHSGQRNCWQKIRNLFYWPGIRQEVVSFAWSHIATDFIEKLPKSQGYDTILVVIDRFTKFGHFIRLTHPFTAKEVAQAFLDNIYKLHGLPESIITDRDKIFTSKFWKELFKLVGTELHYSSSYHSQTDG